VTRKQQRDQVVHHLLITQAATQLIARSEQLAQCAARCSLAAVRAARRQLSASLANLRHT
jgi:hypothetical protein